MKKQIVTAWLLNSKKLESPPTEYKAAWEAAIKRFELKGRAGETALILDGPAPSLLLGIGADDQNRAVHEAVLRAVDIARKQKFDEISLGGVPKESMTAALRGINSAQYSFKISKHAPRKKIIARVIGASKSESATAAIVGEAIAFARDLVNTPPGEKCPAVIAARVASVFKALKRASQDHLVSATKVEIWDEKKLRRERCNGLLAVGAGSTNPPRIMKIEYRPKKAATHLVFVGKGVTFDSGGLNIKTFEGMKTMKCDMAGSAAVVAATAAIARLKLNVRITALVGFVENMLGGAAFKPGDVVTMRSGKTVEILNTDAEGRIVLGDLLDIASQTKGDYIVDLATLTGACLVAIGEEAAGLFTNDSKFAEKIFDASNVVGEAFWRLPIGRDYKDKLKGDISDLKNIGGRYGGASTAAQFLAEFIGDNHWVHLDIAGPAFRESGSSGRPSGATGFGTATLIELAKRLHG